MDSDAQIWPASFTGQIFRFPRYGVWRRDIEELYPSSMMMGCFQGTLKGCKSGLNFFSKKLELKNTNKT